MTMTSPDEPEHRQGWPRPTKPRRPIPWAAIGAVASWLAIVALGAALFLLLRTAREMKDGRDQETKDLTAIRDEVRATQATMVVALSATPHVCLANNSETSCTVTNPTAAPITTCFRGTIVQKKARGVHLSSLVGCTGRIGPHETRTVSTPWAGGFAKDVCASTNRFGTEMLDWDVCEFSPDGVTDDALDKLAQAPAAK